MSEELPHIPSDNIYRRLFITCIYKNCIVLQYKFPENEGKEL